MESKIYLLFFKNYLNETPLTSILGNKLLICNVWLLCFLIPLLLSLKLLELYRVVLISTCCLLVLELIAFKMTSLALFKSKIVTLITLSFNLVLLLFQPILIICLSQSSPNWFISGWIMFAITNIGKDLVIIPLITKLKHTGQ